MAFDINALIQEAAPTTSTGTTVQVVQGEAATASSKSGK